MTRTFVNGAELRKPEAKERNEECGNVVQEFHEVVVRHGVVNLGKGNPSCLYKIRLPLRPRKGNWEGRRYLYLGHEDILSTEAVVRAGVVVKDGGNGEVCVLSHKVHGRHFGFGLDSGHEPASNPRDELEPIDEGDQISLDGNQ